MVWNQADGVPVWFWRHDLPFEPLPEGLAVGSQGQILLATLDGKLLSVAPKQPRPTAPGRVRD